MMNRKPVKRSTKGELAYVQRLQRISAFDLVERADARVLPERDYPEPLRRFLDRERTMLHLKLPAALKRKLEARSRRTGVPLPQLARGLIEQGIEREAG